MGEETLCGEVGLLSLLSKEFAARNSECDAFVCVGDTSVWSSWCCDDDVLSGRSPKGTGSPIFGLFGLFGLTAEVSMVMVGARGRRAIPSEDVSRASVSLLLSAIRAPCRWPGAARLGLYKRAVLFGQAMDADWNNVLRRHADAIDNRAYGLARGGNKGRTKGAQVVKANGRG